MGNHLKRIRVWLLSIHLLLMMFIVAVSFVQLSNAQAGSLELYYDDGVVFGAGGVGFSGVEFSLPVGVSSAKILTIRYMWYAADDALVVHMTGADFTGELTTPISTNSTVGMAGGWNALNVSDRNIVVSGDFCVVAEKPTEGNGILVDNSTNTGRSWWGNSMESMTPVVYPLETENYMIRAVIELPTPTLTLTTNSTSCILNESVELTCNLTLPKNGSVDLYWAIGSSGFIYSTSETITNGVFTIDFPFGHTGTWQFRVSWPGDATSNPSTSNIVTVTVTKDSTPPSITSVTQFPIKTNVSAQDIVKINATVTDAQSGVQQVTLNYTTGNGTWTAISMSNLGGDTWNASIPTLSYGTNVTYVIMALDNAGNNVTTQGSGLTYNYQVIPEFSIPTALLLLFTASTLLVAALRKRKHQ